MSSSSGTFALSNIESLSLSSGNNPDQTQEISHIGEQNVDQETVGLDISKSRPNGNFTPADPSLFSVDNPNQTQEISLVGEQNVDQEMVGLDTGGKSSHNKQRKRTSDVWQKFNKYKDEDGKVMAMCSLCEKLFDGSSKKGTTHLRNHLRSCQKKRNEGGASGSGDKQARNSVTDQQLNHLDRNHFNSCQNKRNEGGASGSGNKPAGNSVTDQQLNHMDRVKTLIKTHQHGFPQPIGDADIINVYNEEKEKLRIYFERLSCRFSLMIMGCGKYTCFIVRFIDDDWKLEEKMIGFKCIEGDQNMKVLENVLLDLGIDKKISSMVTDGDFDKYVLSSDERENRFSDQGSFLFNCKFYDFYVIDDIYFDFEEDFEEEMEAVLNDHVSEIFTYITETSSKIGTFQIAARSLGKEVTAEDIPTVEMLEYMSLLDSLKIALGLKEAFFEFENMDPDFKSINLTKEQWDTIYQFCEEDDSVLSLCPLLYCATANMLFPGLCHLYKKYLKLVTFNSFINGEIYLRLASDAEKCWDEYNLILAVAAVLDPRFKMDIVKHWYKKIYGEKCETQLEIFKNYFTSVYNDYAEGTNNFQSSTSGSKEKNSSISFRMLDISGNFSHDPDSSQSLNSELHQYLNHVNFPLRDDFDLLEWWRVNSRYFPTLAKMARDFLLIKTTVPYDYGLFEFRFPHKEYNSDIVKEAFVCTKSWLTNEE